MPDNFGIGYATCRPRRKFRNVSQTPAIQIRKFLNFQTTQRNVISSSEIRVFFSFLSFFLFFFSLSFLSITSVLLANDRGCDVKFYASTLGLYPSPPAGCSIKYSDKICRGYAKWHTTLPEVPCVHWRKIKVPTRLLHGNWKSWRYQSDIFVDILIYWCCTHR